MTKRRGRPLKLQIPVVRTPDEPKLIQEVYPFQLSYKENDELVECYFIEKIDVEKYIMKLKLDPDSCIIIDQRDTE